MNKSISIVSYKNLIIATIPCVLAAVLEPVAEIIDTAILGHYSSFWIAAMAAACVIFNTLMGMCNFLSYVVTSHIARYFGAQAKQEIKGLILLSSSFAFIIGFIFSISLWLLRESIFINLLHAPHSLMEAAKPYWNYRLVGFPFQLLAMSLLGTLRGLQKIKLSMWCILTIAASNIVVSLILVPHLDIAGAAIGTSFSFMIGSILAIIIILKSEPWLLYLKTMRPSLEQIKLWAKDSRFMFIRSVSLMVGWFIAPVIAIQFGVEYLAAFQITLQLWVIAAFFMDGTGITANTFGAALLGANQTEAFAILQRRLLTISICIGLFFALLYGFGTRQIASLFTHDQKVIAIIVSAGFILAIQQLINSFAFGSDGLIFATKNFAYAAKHIAIGLLICFIPSLALAYYFNSFILIWFAPATLNIYRSWSNYRLLFGKNLI